MRIFKSLLGVILSLVFYLVITTLIFWALELIESIRNWTWFHGGEFYRILTRTLINRFAYSPLDFVLQKLFNNLLASGIGAYLAIIGVNRVLKEYNKKIVLCGFSLVLILFTIHALMVMIPAAEDLGFGLYAFSVQILTPIVAIGAAFFGLFLNIKR